MVYILITPARNEEKDLPQLADCIIRQTVLPNAWIIVDDSSSDNTPEIIHDLEDSNPWIFYKKMENISNEDFSIRDFELHFSRAVKTGFDYAIEVCRDKGISYEYIGKIDADMLIGREHFEMLIQKFESDPKLGDASGYAGSGRIFQTNLVYGGLYLIRRSCFEELGSIPIEYDIDNVIQIKSILRGWKVGTFPEIKFILTRLPTFRTIQRQGFKAYVLGYSFSLILWFLFRMLVTKKPHHIPIFLKGYMQGLIRREPKALDKDVRFFYEFIYPKMLRETLYHAIIRKVKSIE